MEGISTVVRWRPGGRVPVTVHEAMLIELVMVKPRGVIGTPTVALKTGRTPFGCGVIVVAKRVAPAIESMAPSVAAAAAAALRAVPMDDARKKSSVAAATRRAGVRCSRAISVVTDRFIQPPKRRRYFGIFMGIYLGLFCGFRFVNC